MTESVARSVLAGAFDELIVSTARNAQAMTRLTAWIFNVKPRLAAALNVQLRLGGVYIADTDLFQRDVTRFLDADIQPIYFVAKQSA